MSPTVKKSLFTAAALLVVGAIAYKFLGDGREDEVKYRLAPVKHGEVVASIGATGTLEPEEVVDVGAQVAGQILSIGSDKEGRQYDYAGQVEAGAVLATIDESLFKAEVDSTGAQLNQARASRATADAALLQAKARLVFAKRDWDRAQITGPAGAISASAFDGFRATYDVAVAEVSVAEAAVTRADADIVQSQATLDRAKRNLAFCIIKSPVDGTIIDRRVNVGQTVVASLNTPSLFLIAKDLKRMEVWVAVNEVDIGRIAVGMDVSFTVDTFPGRTFHGKVSKRRLNAAMTQNVVTYVVEVSVLNDDRVLIPYLTANVKFETGRNADTLYVPNVALTWTPSDYVEPKPAAKPVAGDPEVKAEAKPETPRDGAGHGGKGRTARKNAQEKRPGVLWVLRDGKPAKVDVTASLSDGIVTAVSGEGIADGDQVIVGESRPQAASSDVSKGTPNPFAPQAGGRRGR